MSRKAKISLALFLAFAVLVQYSFSPQALFAYGLNNTSAAAQSEEQATDDSKDSDKQETTKETEETKATESTEPSENAEEPEGDTDESDANAEDKSESDADNPDAEDPDTEESQTDDMEEDSNKETVKYPAVTFSEKADGVQVNISAPEGALPENATVKVKAVKASKIKDAVEELIDEGKVVKAVDITFYDADGEQIEPKEKISVTFVSKEFSGLNEAQVVHISDEGVAETVKNSSVDGNKAKFKSDEFSIYAVVTEGDDARVLVKFAKPNGTEIASMYVKKGDNMEQVLYDPGVGEALTGGVYFRGWTTEENYTPQTDALSIAEVRTEVEGMLPPDSDGEEVTFYAMLFKDYRITYLDENEISLGQEEKTFRADASSAEQSYTVNMAYTVQDDTHHFEGWNVVEGGSHISGHTQGTVYENNDVITITGDVTFGVEAPEGHWFIFDENGRGATYNAPQFIQSDQHPTRPNDSNMLRNGYTFGGWFADKSVADQTSGGTQYNFNLPLSDKTTVYARWIPKTTANYTIIIWKQNLDGNGYDFEESVSQSGNVGSVINTVRQQGTGNNAYAQIRQNNQWVSRQYTGFHLNKFFISSL